MIENGASSLGAAVGKKAFAGDSPAPLPATNSKGITGEMKKPPSFPFYVQDWLASPTRLQMNMSERGLYWDLLAIAWDSDPPCTIPKSAKIVAKICGVRTQTIRKFHADFTQTFVTYGEDKSRLYNKKLLEIYQEMLQHREKRQDAGKAGAEARWQTHGNRIELPLAKNGSSSSSSLSSSFSSSNTLTAACDADPITKAFEEFWKEYPIHRQGSRTMALASWIRVPLIEMHPTEILAGLRLWLNSEKWKSDQFIPYAQNFIEKHYWKLTPPPVEDSEPAWKKKRREEEHKRAEGIHELLELAKQPRPSRNGA